MNFWQKFLPQPKRLFIELNHNEDTELSLKEIIAGSAGRVVLGSQQIGLWSPTVRPEDIARKPEWVCDMRFAPLSYDIHEHFRKATQGLFLPASFVVFRGKNPQKIALALEHFDYVIVPSRHRIKNLPKDFQRRVLGYTPRKKHKYAPRIADQ